MGDSDEAALLFRPAHELARLVRSGAVSAVELVSSSLNRLEAINETLNALTFIDAERALSEAEQIKPGDVRPFAGVPIAIKDIVPVERWPLTVGSRLFGNYRAERDAYVVKRLRRSGFIPVAQTTSSEMGISPVTETLRYGATRNPWDTTRTCGGSSGGSAVVVAAGGVPIAHGSDGGGSIRVPASCCGLVGLKPSRGRVSRGPVQGDHLLSVDSVLSRTVQDTALALDELAGYELGDATWAPPPAEPFAVTAQRAPRSLRVAITLDPPVDVPVEDERAEIVRTVVGVLCSLGHEVEELDPWPDQQVLPLFEVLWAVSAAAPVGMAGFVTGREPSPELVEPLTWHFYQRARETDTVSLALAMAQVNALVRPFVEALHPFDAVLTPALAEPPVRVGVIDPLNSDPQAAFRRSTRFTPFTPVANVSGLPAISLPVGLDQKGLPLAVQIYGAPAGEGPLLALASQLEEAFQWQDRRPPQFKP
jgi:amidase